MPLRLCARCDAQQAAFAPLREVRRPASRLCAFARGATDAQQAAFAPLREMRRPASRLCARCDAQQAVFAPLRLCARCYAQQAVFAPLREVLHPASRLCAFARGATPSKPPLRLCAFARGTTSVRELVLVIWALVLRRARRLIARVANIFPAQRKPFPHDEGDERKHGYAQRFAKPSWPGGRLIIPLDPRDAQQHEGATDEPAHQRTMRAKPAAYPLHATMHALCGS